MGQASLAERVLNLSLVIDELPSRPPTMNYDSGILSSCRPVKQNYSENPMSPIFFKSPASHINSDGEFRLIGLFVFVGDARH